MIMSLAVYEKTRQAIDDAYLRKDQGMLEKETQFVITALANDISETFSDSVRFIALRHIKLKEANSLLNESYRNNILQVLDTLIRKDLSEFSNLKFIFDKYFLESTQEGFIDYEYDSSELVSAEEAGHYLGVSKQTVYKYLEKGLEYKEINGKKRIPKAALKLWSDPSTAFELQWISQQNKIRKQTNEDKLGEISKIITRFELEYGGTFESLYGHLSSKEIDLLDEAVDVFDWEDCVKEKRRLLDLIREKRGL